MKNIAFLYGLLLLATLSFSHLVAAEMTVTLEDPANDVEAKIAKRLATSPTLKAVTEFINTYFDTPKGVTLYFGSYTRIWHKNRHIEIPYLFIEDTRKHYKNTRFTHKNLDVDTYTGNVLLHVILHEFAHALIAHYNLPVLGKEEDAADTFADVMLIHFFENGSDIVISAADLFFINDKRMRRFVKEDFWSEHSLDKQRYYGRLCNAYGSNPSAYNNIKRQADFDEDKAERCIYQYRQTEHTWLNMLIVAPAFKAGVAIH